jgi:hypothetical protein
VTALPRQPGQKEGRFMHLLGGTPDLSEFDAPKPAAVHTDADLVSRIEALEAAVEALQQQFAAIKGGWSE